MNSVRSRLAVLLDAVSARPRLAGAPVGALLLVVASLVFWQNAWVSDDAFITFRSVEQFHAGNGPRWNPHERVQAFTHPLWFLLLATARLGSRNLLAISLVLSWLATVGALLVGFRIVGRDPWRQCLLLALLLSSRAFVDYSSSGLENALVHLLLALFLRTLIDAEIPEPRRGARVALLTALLMLCRHDLILLVLPPLVGLWARRRELRRAKTVALAMASFSPFMLWTFFAVAYYGFPFPNTAYAKLGTGLSQGELFRQGIHYIENSMLWDPITVLVIAAGIVTAFRRGGLWRDAGWGLCAYLAYVVRIGGDFMAGRFLSAAALMAALVVLRHGEWQRLRGPIFAGVAMTQVFLPGAPIQTGPNTRAPFDYEDADEHGIADEKGHYFSDLSVWHYREGRFPRLPLGPPRSIGTAGVEGYRAPLAQILVDPYALSDAFLARLPTERPWRIGHFRRAIPPGYLETLRTGRSEIANPALSALYDRIRLITQGPLWSAERWRAIAELNLHPTAFECSSPPCLTLRVHELPVERYRPMFDARAGRLESVTVSGNVVVASGWLPWGGAREGRALDVALPHTPVATEVVGVIRPEIAKVLDRPNLADAGFRLELRFSDGAQAVAAAERLCVAAELWGKERVLLDGDRPVCEGLWIREGMK